MAGRQLPLNIQLMDIDQIIKERGLKEVTSVMVHSSSSSQFDPNGLFSEQIFGEIASPERHLRHGWIDLHCTVFNPIAFQNIQSIRRFYVEIMSGKAYAVWNKYERDFDKASEYEDGADTGFAFFLKHFHEINFKKNNSLKRNDKIDVLIRYKNQILINKMLVCPAAIRDMREEDGRVEKDSINSLYASLINNSKAMPPGSDNDPIYDTVHYAIQRKVLEIYEYLLNMFSGKTGFAEGKYGHRAIAQGTRNVITATSLESASPYSPQYHKVDESKIPLFQAAKGFSSLVVHYIKNIFYSPIVSDTADQVALIDPDTLGLTYVPISSKDKDLLLTSEGIMKTIDRFRDPEFRFRPVTAMSDDGKKYYLYLLYDDGKKIFVFRDLAETKRWFEDSKIKWDQDKVRPMSYAEMLYVATYVSANGKYGTITRYPVTDENSIYPCRTHVVSTSPGRIVRWVTNLETGAGVDLPEYPMHGSSFIDAATLHPSKLKGLGADFDGNCVLGDTKIQIRFTKLWLEVIKTLDYKVSGQLPSVIENNLLKHSQIYVDPSKHVTYYSDVNIEDIPRPGEYQVDKNGAHVFTLPNGCEVLSIVDSKPTWCSFDKVTVETDCEYIRLKVGGRHVDVSTNPSVAVFDHETGGLKKVKPVDAQNCFVPVVIRDRLPFGKIGSYDDGWLLGVLVSDGYLTEKYLGYTKLDPKLRERVINLLQNAVAKDILFKTYSEGPGENKLGSSESIHFTDERVKNFAETLNMYTSETRNALTKTIPLNTIMNASEDYCLGLLAGLLDGDGSVVYDTSHDNIQFRFSTSSAALKTAVCRLLYRLGIRYNVTVVPARGWSKETYVVLMRESEMRYYRDQLICFGDTNSRVLEIWKAGFDDVKAVDPIPLTVSERDALTEIAKSTFPEDVQFFNRVIISGFTRSRLFRYIQYIKDSHPSLVKRIVNSDVCWRLAKVDGAVKVGTVYDLLVPESKVFAVNNGLIIYDTISWIPIFSKEANEECEAYTMDISNYVMPSGDPVTACDDLCNITMYAMTAEPPKSKK